MLLREVNLPSQVTQALRSGTGTWRKRGHSDLVCPRFYLWCFSGEVPKDKDGLLMLPGKGTQRTKVLVAFESGNVTPTLGWAVG